MGEGDRISMSHRARSGSLGILNLGVGDQAGQGKTLPPPLASGSGPSSAVSSFRSVQHPPSS